MSDVFISYAREDRTLAQALAKDLEGHGYRVWWDAELVGSDDFQDVILAALERAGAAIVIWTKTSVKSVFVRDEARYALHYNKLITVKAPDLAVLELPFGFQGHHTEDLNNRGQIVRALTKLGVGPATNAPVAVLAADTWDSVKTTRDTDLLLDWLERNPTHEKRQEAHQRVRSLVGAGKDAVKERPAPIARMSNWSAFLSGLTFRLPSFQLSTQGQWSSIGLSIGLVVLLVVGFTLATGVTDAIWGTDTVGANISSAVCALLLARFAKARFAAFVEQRLWIAAWIVAPFLALLAAILFALVGVIAAGGSVRSDAGGWSFFVGFQAGLLLSVVYMVRKARSLR